MGCGDYLAQRALLRGNPNLTLTLTLALALALALTLTLTLTLTLGGGGQGGQGSGRGGGRGGHRAHGAQLIEAEPCDGAATAARAPTGRSGGSK